jgi:SAM-dependent methyltransferase
LLDLGCGHGHFLEMAANAGWAVWGVDVLPEAVCAARKRVPSATVLEGELRQARLEGGSLDAITLWDALDQFQDPAAELEECRRILRRDGRIGIRVRNAASQLALYRIFQRSEWLWRKAEIKPPYAFHLYSFTRRSLHRLLAATGLTDISIRNSPFSQGDPYGHSPHRGILETGKRFFELAAEGVDNVSGGGFLIAPSLLAWARKP